MLFFFCENTNISYLCIIKNIENINMQKHKILGQVYTPSWIVSEMLNHAQYEGASICDKYILEPSCGDGAFLCEIVKRYILGFRNRQSSNDEII